MAATKTSTDKIRVGRLVEYHGSKRFYHGIVFRVIANRGGYDLGYAFDDGTSSECILKHARRESVTPVNARDYWRSFKRCKTAGCGTQFRGDVCPSCEQPRS